MSVITNKLLSVLNERTNDWTELGKQIIANFQREDVANVIAADPFSGFRDFNYSTQAMVFDLVPGNYPVYLLIRDSGSMGLRNYYAYIKTLDIPVTKIVRAQHGNGNSFWVEAGLACFMDMSTAHIFWQHVKDFYAKKPKLNFYDKEMLPLFENNPRDATKRLWINYHIPKTDRNIYVFQSGLGDGAYTGYKLIGKGGKQCGLMIDFDVEKRL
jgi:hypothetical protein